VKPGLLNVCLALGLAASLPALGQTTQQQTQQQATREMARGKVKGDAFVRRAARDNEMEVRMSQMAQDRSQNDAVRQYAQRLKQDHSEANKKLKTIASDLNIQLAPPVAADQRQMPADREMQRLQGMSGDQFDRQFVETQIRHHRRDIAQYEQIANDANVNPEIRQYAEQTLPALREHLQMAQDIQTQLNAARRSGAAGRTGQ
jgi:Predicted outer membrane protein